mmetsp:Transcript_13871/g.39578  ORF Transcript_13871/g.39578 Transcript_13871/m.39578 type:complete len:231 (+) Transcript_13871:976-1668(+)
MSVSAWNMLPPAMKSFKPQPGPPAPWRHIVGGRSLLPSLPFQDPSGQRGFAATSTEPCSPGPSSCDKTAKNDSNEYRKPVGGGGPVVVTVVLVVVCVVDVVTVIVVVVVTVVVLCGGWPPPSPNTCRMGCMNGGTQSFLMKTVSAPLSLPPANSSVSCADLDGDGDDDVSLSSNHLASGIPRAEHRFSMASRPSPGGMPLPISALATRNAICRWVTAAVTWPPPRCSKST